MSAPLTMSMPATNLSNLCYLLRAFIVAESTTINNLAPEIGISKSTLSRICAGYSMDADTLLTVINWLVRERQ